MRTASKFMGFLKVTFSIMWIGLCILGLDYGQQGLKTLNDNLITMLFTADNNISDVNLLLTELMDVMDMADKSLETIEEAMIDAGISVEETLPMIDETSDVIANDIPDALDEVQDAMPGVIEAAAVIDEALTVLAGFHYEIPKPFSDENWVISLGVNYNPSIPLDMALQNLSDKLESIPEDMRGVENDLANANVNMVIISDDLLDVASDLELIRDQVADINPKIQMIRANLSQIQESIHDLQRRIPERLEITRKWFVGVMILVIITQIPSAYFGWVIARTDDYEFKSGNSTQEQGEDEK